MRRPAVTGRLRRVRKQIAARLVEFGDGRGLVTWEQRFASPDILTVTNVWPHAEKPAYGPFVRVTVEGLDAVGIKSDVLFVRGYTGIGSYLCGALTMVLLRAASPRYALVHAHGGETALIARLYLGAPVVASYLGSDLLAPQVGGWRFRSNCRIRSAVVRLHAISMTATTTKTDEMEGVLPARVRQCNTVIPDGIDLQRFHPIDQQAARRHLGWPPRVPIVLFAGRAEAPEKRLWLARQAVDKARHQLPGLQLKIATGVAPKEMPYYYSAADCLVHTSASEGSPNVIKEALACNLPVVATPAGDIDKLLAGARPGRVVAADRDALAREIIRCCRVPRRSNGRSLTGRMDLHRAAAATLELYRRLDPSLGKRFARSSLCSLPAPSAESDRLRA